MITFGDIPLLVPDAEVQALVDSLLPLAEVELYGRLPVDTGSRTASQRHAVALPAYNWPSAPSPRLNCLYWPSGATRWARGWFLCDGKSKDEIVALAHSSNGTTALELAFGTEPEAGVGTPTNIQYVDLYLLPPRPLPGIEPGHDQTAAEKKEALWLLPLVDARYFWQFTSSGLLEPTTSTTWATLFSTLGTALGETITADTVDADYLTPDPVEFTRRYVPIAALLDAAAASVGQRITRDPEDGTVKSQSITTAETALAENYLLDFSLAAGGSFDAELGDLPANVRVNFRRWSQYAVYCDGEVYTKTAATTDSSVSGKDKIILSSLFAEYPSGTAPNSASAPTNATQLTALTDQVADDFYGWLAKRFDVAFHGIVDWEPTGFDDAILWDCQSGRTRVWSLPAGVGVGTQLSQDSDYQVIDEHPLGILDGDMAEGGTATVSIREWDAGTTAWIDTGLNVVARDYFLGAGEEWEATTLVWLSWQCPVWVVVQASCAPDSGGGGGGGGGGAASQSTSHLGGLLPNGYEPGTGNEFSGSTEWHDYDSLFSQYVRN